RSTSRHAGWARHCLPGDTGGAGGRVGVRAALLYHAAYIRWRIFAPVWWCCGGVTPVHLRIFRWHSGILVFVAFMLDGRTVVAHCRRAFAILNVFAGGACRWPCRAARCVVRLHLVHDATMSLAVWRCPPAQELISIPSNR